MSTLRSEMNLARQKTTFRHQRLPWKLKTPLTSIRLFAEMLKEGAQPTLTGSGSTSG